MLIVKCWNNLLRDKPRRGDTLLTVGFNLRQINMIQYSKSRRDDTFLTKRISSRIKVSSLRDLRERACTSFRRLKPAVNKMSSLQDFFNY